MESSEKCMDYTIRPKFKCWPHISEIVHKSPNLSTPLFPPLKNSDDVTHVRINMQLVLTFPCFFLSFSPCLPLCLPHKISVLSSFSFCLLVTSCLVFLSICPGFHVSYFNSSLTSCHNYVLRSSAVPTLIVCNPR